MKLRVDGVSFAFPGRPVLHDVSFQVPAGRFVGLLGPNGAGKSTLLRCLHEELRPSKGGVFIDGVAVAELSRREVARRVSVVPQTCSPALEVSVAEFVRMGRYAREGLLGTAGPEDLDAVRGALDAVGMTSAAERSVHELSGGEFRRVLVAQALAQQTPVLLLDEPVQQLDLLHQVEVMELVRRVARRPDAAAVAVLHDLGLAARFCDEVVLLAHGRVAAAGRPEDVITKENLRRVYGVDAVVDRCAATGAVRVVPLAAAGAEGRSS